MLRTLAAAIASGALVIGLLATSGPAPAAAPAAPTIAVDGQGVGMYPSFDPAVTRYAVRSTGQTAGTVRVSVQAPGASVRINGHAAPDGTRTVTGLEGGDEISVLLDTATGRAAYALVYLPADFPALERVATGTGGQEAAGQVLLTVGGYETAVDPNGVPVHLEHHPGAMDLKPLTGGGYTVARPTTAAGRTGSDVVHLDAAFRPVRTYRTADLVDTDGHDSILQPDGSIWLMAYERRSDQADWDPGADPAVPDWQDSVIQHVSAGGDVLFEWSTRDELDGREAVETTHPVDPFGTGPYAQDYTHINSFQLVDGGRSMLASFRNLSSVWKIAVTDHDGWEEGEVIWKLGGRDSDFSFVAPGGAVLDGGPCAQHTAYEVSADRVLVFDNGADGYYGGEPLCLDPDDPAGDTVTRIPTRVSEWELDPPATPGDTGTATRVWNYQGGGRYAIFAGGSQRLAGGHTLVNWGSSTAAVVTEVDATATPVWELRSPASAFSYRAFKADVPDVLDPEVVLRTAVAGATYAVGQVVAPVAECTDRGGSTLRSCDVPPVDTASPGRHTYVATATDGAGNTTEQRATYTVQAAPTPPVTKAPARPDAVLRVRGGDTVGGGTLAWPNGPRAVVRLRQDQQRRGVLRVRNTGDLPGRFSLTRTRDGRSVRTTLPGARQARRSPMLDPGETWTIRFVVERTGARSGRDVRIRVRSIEHPSLRDAVRLRVRGR